METAKEADTLQKELRSSSEKAKTFEFELVSERRLSKQLKKDLKRSSPNGSSKKAPKMKMLSLDDELEDCSPSLGSSGFNELADLEAD